MKPTIAIVSKKGGRDMKKCCKVFDKDFAKGFGFGFAVMMIVGIIIGAFQQTFCLL